MTPRFLTVDEVVRIHRDQIRRYGGMVGIRDSQLLQSAVAQPEATFDAELLHRDLFEMAAAYLYHIVCNHPFLDGNKRTGAAAALVFLLLNDVTVRVREDEFVELVLGVARGEVAKSGVVAFLRDLSD